MVKVFFILSRQAMGSLERNYTKMGLLMGPNYRETLFLLLPVSARLIATIQIQYSFKKKIALQ